jgi:hypothetical protein
MEFIEKSETTNILFFGCWNRGQCRNIKNGEDIEDNEQTDVNDINVQNKAESKTNNTNSNDKYINESYNNDDDATNENEQKLIDEKIETEPKNEKAGEEMSNTLNKLKEYIAESGNTTNAVIVAGDNYYPHKYTKKMNGIKQKFKEVNFGNMEMGFKCLKDAVGIIETHVLLGNHDVEYLKKNECAIIEKEIEITGKNHNIKLFNFNDTDERYRIYGNSIVIFLDSTIYDNDEKHFECYNHVIDGVNNVDNIEIRNSVKNNQIEFADEIVDIIEKNNLIKNVIFTAHHPIVGLKSKDDKEKLDVMEDFVNFLKTEFLEKLGDNNHRYYHLCADVHNYQQVKINIHMGDDTYIPITQYVVGTGGAEKDVISKGSLKNFYIEKYYTEKEKTKEESKEEPAILFKYRLIKYKYENGFLHVEISDDTAPVFSFISATTPTTHAGGNRKKRMTKRKTKKPAKNIKKTHKKKHTKKRQSMSARCKSSIVK